MIQITWQVIHKTSQISPINNKTKHTTANTILRVCIKAALNVMISWYSKIDLHDSPLLPTLPQGTVLQIALCVPRGQINWINYNILWTPKPWIMCRLIFLYSSKTVHHVIWFLIDNYNHKHNFYDNDEDFMKICTKICEHVKFIKMTWVRVTVNFSIHPLEVSMFLFP